MSETILSPKLFDIKIGGNAFNNYIREGFSYSINEGMWYKNGEPYIYQVFHPELNTMISVNGPEFRNAVATKYAYDKNRNELKRAVLLPSKNKMVTINSKEFNDLLKTHAYNVKENKLVKYKIKIKEGYTNDPTNGKQIQIGGEKYEKLRLQGYVFDQQSNLMKKRELRNGFVINPKTLNWIKVNGETFDQLISEGYKYIEHTNSLEKPDYCRLKRVKDHGQFKQISHRTDIEPAGENEIDIHEYERKIKHKVIDEYQKQFKRLGPIKVVLVTCFNYEEKTSSPTYKWSSSINTAPVILNHDEVPKVVDQMFTQMGANIQDYHQTDTGGVLTGIGLTSAYTFKYDPLKTGSYIETPVWIKNKRAVINVQNSDEKCIIWSILACLHSTDKHANRVSKYKQFEQEIKTDGINFPINLNDISKLEDLNKIKINIIDYRFKNMTENIFIPFYVSNKKFETEINLLRIHNENKAHYCWIKKPSRLFAQCNSHEHKRFWCFRCLTSFTSKKSREDHFKENKCLENDGIIQIKMPKGSNNKPPIIQFKNFNKQLKIPFIFYCDAESFLVKTDLKKGVHSQIYEEHKANSFGCYFKSNVEEFNSTYTTFEGVDCTEKFLKYLLATQKRLISYLNTTNKTMTLTTNEKYAYGNAKNCHICGLALNKDKVRDHDHLTGKYRGAAHSACNLKYNYRNVYIPVVFHNLKGYDSHLIMQSAGKVVEEINRKERESRIISSKKGQNKPKKPREIYISVIANSSEKFMSFTIDKLRFIDSLNFMSTSLDNLVENLKKSKGEFSHFKSQFQNLTEEQIALIMKKGVYPYEYMSDPTKFKETQLPPIEEFSSTLYSSAINGELKRVPISDDNYEHAKNVYKELKCETLKDYHDLYLKTDVMLLADCFENFRRTCLKYYDLDPAHYLTAPGLSWDAMLKKTNVKIELFQDQSMLEFIECGMRGGISVISHRYAKANNKYMNSYEENEASSFIIYVDANNLYGWAMSQALPFGGYRWETNVKKITTDLIMKLQDDSEMGCVLMVDLEYPSNIHDTHNDYPFCAEQIYCEPSQYMQNVMQNLTLPKPAPVKKLTPNLNNKKSYVIHYRNLKQAIKNGLILKKVHKVLWFKQSKWLSNYIEFNTNMRSKAENDFEKDFFKLLNNSIFGKTCENLRKRIDVRLVTSPEKLQKLVNKPNFKDARKIADNLFSVSMAKTSITFDRPVIVGFSVLELSKVLMYDFHYDVMKRKYGDRAKLLFTDTDSLCYHIHTGDIYEDLKPMQDLFDFSDYPKSHSLHSDKNKKVIGKFKDESAASQTLSTITEFVGLRSKSYSYQSEVLESISGDGIHAINSAKKAKGVVKHCVKKQIRFDDYKDCVLVHKIARATYHQIRSFNHKIVSIKSTKMALCPYDEKRWVCDDGISTYAHGHYLINHGTVKNVINQ